MASCSARFASSMIILFEPRRNAVTARELAHSSMTSMRSRVVPKLTSRTRPAWPSLSALRSSKRGTMRPFVAMAISSSSGPPTQRTAGSSCCRSRWFASSSKPHWHTTRFAPVSLIFLIMPSNVFRSYSSRRRYSSTELMSSLCFVFGRGGSSGHVRIAMRASRISRGIWGCDMSLSITTPCTSAESSSAPPTLPSTLISSKSTSRRSRSATLSTASIAMRANFSEAFETLRQLGTYILLPRHVFVTFSSSSVCARSNTTASALFSMAATAMSHARSNPSAMRIG